MTEHLPEMTMSDQAWSARFQIGDGLGPWTASVIVKIKIKELVEQKIHNLSMS